MLQDRLPQVPSGTKLAEGSPHQLLDLAFSRSLQGPSWLKLLQDPPTRLLELHRMLALSLPKCRPAPPGAWALQDPRGPLGGASPEQGRPQGRHKATQARVGGTKIVATSDSHSLWEGQSVLPLADLHISSCKELMTISI